MIPRPVAAKSLAQSFRLAARRFLEIDPDDAVSTLELGDHCGRLLAEAVRAGLLRLPIEPLIEWVEGKSPHPTNPAAEGGPDAATARAVLVRQWHNLWWEVVGDHLVELRLTDEGWVAAPIAHGGLLPPLRPHRPPLPRAQTARALLYKWAEGATWLAEMIEAGGGDAPPTYTPSELADALEVGLDTLRRFRRLAGLPPLPRGARNRRLA
ncbi:MAG: hypothetical protein ACK4PI_07355, partial [Tepidisphaerales bacterium]